MHHPIGRSARVASNSWYSKIITFLGQFSLSSPEGVKRVLAVKARHAPNRKRKEVAPSM